MFASDETHGYSKSQREAMVWWMRRWLLNDTSPVIEPELSIQKDEDLLATETGQVVSNWEDEVTVADLNLKRAKELASKRDSFWQEHDKVECLAEVKRLIGLRENREKPSVEDTDTIQRNGYRIEKLIINREGEIPVPGLLFLPNKKGNKSPATLYVDGRGKDADAAVDGSIAKLVSEGRMVLTIDVRGFGETADAPERNAGKYWNDEHRNAYIAMHIGRPLLRQRVEDVLAALDVLVQREDVDSKAISLIGIGRAGPVVLHAAALDSRFADVTIQYPSSSGGTKTFGPNLGEEGIESWVDVVAAPLAHNQLTHVVPFALTRYDLFHLAQAISPRPVRILNPVDAYGKPKKTEE